MYKSIVQQYFICQTGLFLVDHSSIVFFSILALYISVYRFWHYIFQFIDFGSIYFSSGDAIITLKYKVYTLGAWLHIWVIGH